MRAAALALIILASAAPARADWLLTPFFATTFAGSNNLVTLDPGNGNKKFTFGASFGFLTDGILGIEASTAHTPHFFESGGQSLATGSGVTILDGSVIVAVPQAITGYSLRPYLVSGVGLMHITREDPLEIGTFDSNLLALNIGGGAIGMLSNNSGVRFEVRQFRNLKPDDSNMTTSGQSTRISFWRASMGVVFRF